MYDPPVRNANAPIIPPIGFGNPNLILGNPIQHPSAINRAQAQRRITAHERCEDERAARRAQAEQERATHAAQAEQERRENEALAEQRHAEAEQQHVEAEQQHAAAAEARRIREEQ